jgi:hypothetical protein
MMYYNVKSVRNDIRNIDFTTIQLGANITIKMETENIPEVSTGSRKRPLEEADIVEECDNQEEVSDFKKPKLDDSHVVPSESIPVPDEDSEDEEYQPVPEEEEAEEPIEPTHFSDEEQGEINIDIDDYLRFKANLLKELLSDPKSPAEEAIEEPTHEAESGASEIPEENAERSVEEEASE